ARKRLGQSWLLQASYTYARSTGNYPGIYSPYNNQRDPNLSTLYDLPDALANRNGPLPNDVPHQLKLAGAYTVRLGALTSLVLGTSMRAQSGTPRGTFGIHPVYVAPEVFLLPAGRIGRNDALFSWDGQLAVVRELPRKQRMQIFLAVYNLLDREGVLARDDAYTLDFVAPVVSGTEADLRHLKTTGGLVATKNPAFGHPTQVQ